MAVDIKSSVLGEKDEPDPSRACVVPKVSRNAMDDALTFFSVPGTAMLLLCMYAVNSHFSTTAMSDSAFL